MCAHVCMYIMSVGGGLGARRSQERKKPVSDQAGSVQCESCGSRGGLAVHRCRRPEELEPTAQGGAATAQGEVVCSEDL